MDELKKILMLFAAACAFAGCSNAIINPNIKTYQKLYGLPHEDEVAIMSVNAYEGGFISVGINEAIGSVQDSVSDISLTKYADDGTLLKNYILNCSDYDDIHSIIRTVDGGYVMAGRTFMVVSGESDILIVKLSAALDVQWAQSFRGNSDDRPLCIKQEAGGNFVIAGATASFGAGSMDMLVLKLTSTGDLIWSRTLGKQGYDLAHSLIINDDSTYIITGWVSDPGGSGEDIAVVKMNTDGTIIWQKIYGGAGSDLAFSIEEAGGNNCIITGSSQNDGCLLNLSVSTGNVNYYNTFGGGQFDQGRDIKRSIDGGFILAGFTFSSGAGDGDAMLVKFNSQGSLQYAYTYGETLFDIAYSIMKSADGGYIMTGSHLRTSPERTDISIIKTSSSGESCIGRSFANISQSFGNINNFDAGLTITSPAFELSNKVVTKVEFPANQTDLCSN